MERYDFHASWLDFCYKNKGQPRREKILIGSRLSIVSAFVTIC